MPESINMGIPGANPGGVQNLVPTTGGTSVPAIGGSTNPMVPSFPSGSAMPSPSSGMSTSGGSTDPLIQALLGLSPAGPGAATGPQGNIGGLSIHDLVGYFHKAGFPSGIGYLLANFLAGGAGFSPEVAKAMLAALQPGIERGQASIVEQFGGMGLRYGSPAAIGLGDFMSQVTLDEGQILSQLYEQAVQNYMQVLLAGKKGQQSSGIGSIIGGVGSLISALSTLGGGAAAGGAAAASGGAAAASEIIPTLGAALV